MDHKNPISGALRALETLNFPKASHGFRAIVWCVVLVGELRPGTGRARFLEILLREGSPAPDPSPLPLTRPLRPPPPSCPNLKGVQGGLQFGMGK